MTNKYESPLSSRYASDYMLGLFSSDTRYQTWRRLWVSLAKQEMKLGLPITEDQVAELEAHITDIDYEVVRLREKEVRHDVMAHVYAYGKVAPSAAGIIHLGATSCYVTDNADLVIYRDALKYIRAELLKVIANLAKFADEYKAMPALGYTHYQPAQPVTIGKRATLWMQDFVSDIGEIDFALENIKSLSGVVSGEARKTLLSDAHLKVGEKKHDLIWFLDREMSVVKSLVAELNVQWRKYVDTTTCYNIITPFVQNDERSEIENRKTANGGKPIESQLESIQRFDRSSDPEQRQHLRRL